VFEAETPSAVVSVDETRAHRVLANLLTKSIKHSPDGGPVRVIVKEADGPDGKAAVLVMRDQGLGIPRDNLPYVFDRFHRGANVVGRFTGGSAAHASWWSSTEAPSSVESEEGSGSTFVVRLPLARPIMCG
jgi:signal transduction histidine kinase